MDSRLKEEILANINIILMYLRAQQGMPDGRVWPKRSHVLHLKLKMKTQKILVTRSLKVITKKYKAR